MIAWLRTKAEVAAARLDLDIAPEVMRAARVLDDLWYKLPPGDLANQVAELQNQLLDLHEREEASTKESHR